MVTRSRLSVVSGLLGAAAVLLGCAGPAPSGSPANSAAPPASSFAPRVAVPTVAATPAVDPTEEASEPTAEPILIPSGAYTPRTAVEINDVIVDRPGVPADLHDRYWWSGGDAGQVGTTAQIGLPADEYIHIVAGGFVVSERRSGGYTAAANHLVIRDFHDGRVVRELSSGVHFVDVAMVGTALFWTGTMPDVLPEVDGGVWVVDLAANDDPIAVVQPGRALLRNCSRRLVASGSGRTIAATAACDGANLWSDLIDVESRSRTDRLRDVRVVALTDELYVVSEALPGDYLAYGADGLAGIDRSTGAVRWRFPDSADADRFLLGQMRAIEAGFLVEYYLRTRDGANHILAVLDPATGQERRLLRQPADDLGSLNPAFAASSSTSLLLTAHFGLLVWEPAIPVSVLNLESGVLTRDAFVIDTPWLCFEDYCLRD